MNSLFNFCLYFANNKQGKCSDFFNEIQSIENLFYSNISLKLILVTFLIFIFHYFISKKLLGNIQNKILASLNNSQNVNISKIKKDFLTNSSCGVCGKSSLDALEIIKKNKTNSSEPKITKEIIIQSPNIYCHLLTKSEVCKV